MLKDYPSIYTIWSNIDPVDFATWEPNIRSKHERALNVADPDDAEEIERIMRDRNQDRLYNLREEMDYCLGYPIIAFVEPDKGLNQCFLVGNTLQNCLKFVVRATNADFYVDSNYDIRSTQISAHPAIISKVLFRKLLIDPKSAQADEFAENVCNGTMSPYNEKYTRAIGHWFLGEF